MKRRIPERPETPPLARKKESDLTDFSEQDTADEKPAAAPRLSARDKAAAVAAFRNPAAVMALVGAFFGAERNQPRR